jgi:UDP-N-acetylmuramate: L-alanyl-gamma-D-glutamyl-meso-diaminopimelate ligase
MSELLEAAGVEPLVGYDAAHLERGRRPDLVIVGNAVRRDNPEAVAAERLGIDCLSMPAALARFFLAGRRPLVVSGTHGKTTTSALAAWVYSACGAEPGYLVGGLPHDLQTSFAAGTGPRFIVEGDEYNAAYFDRGAKFLHYMPETLILTSVEYDHADLYPSPEALRAAYATLIAQLPASGLLIACGDTAEVRELAARAPCEVVLYGFAEDLPLRPLRPPAFDSARTELLVPDAAGRPPATLRLRLMGEHNASNALAVWAAARHDGLEAAAVAVALESFHGVRRRQEEVGTAAGVTVVDDFAHHPTAVGKTLRALRQRYPGRRLTALFEPRSLTAGRSFFFEPYVEAFAEADRVLFAPLFHAGRLRAEERLDVEALVARLASRGVAAAATASVDDLVARAVAEGRAGDVLVTMSSGDFRGAPRRLLASLGSR